MVPDAYQMLYGRGMASLAGALEQLPHPPERLFFVSSTAVWGGAEGRLDEDSPQVPGNFRGEWLIQAENTLRATGLPLTVLYPGGIYGDRSHRLWQKLDDPDATVRLSGRPLHRIHQQDLAAALVHLMLLEAPATRYLLLDDDPLSQASLLVQMAGMRGVRAPHVTVDLSGPERYFSNARLKAEGFSLKLPSIRDYLRTML
jgi:nucleoside-diphosphate-sugar epimerase